MKKLLAVLLLFAMVFSLACCGASDSNSTVAQHLADVFKDNADKSAQDIANQLINDESITFMGTTMVVEEGLLNGFGNEEISGFSEGVMFGPMISTIPFVGYVFTLDEDTDKKAFVKNLEDNADLAFNICTVADEVVVEQKGDKVVVIISPENLQEDGAEDEMVVDGEEFVDEFAQ